MRHIPGVMVAMRYQAKSGFDGLCVWKQNGAMQTKIIDLDKSWIDYNYKDQKFAEKIMRLSKVKPMKNTSILWMKRL